MTSPVASNSVAMSGADTNSFMISLMSCSGLARMIFFKEGKDIRYFIFVGQSETHYSFGRLKFSKDIYNIGRMSFSEEITQTPEIFRFNEFLDFGKKYLCPLQFRFSALILSNLKVSYNSFDFFYAEGLCHAQECPS